MEIYQKDGVWIARAAGGNRNSDNVPAEERHIPGMLEPVAAWEDHQDSREGEAVYKRTLFAHGSVPVLTLIEMYWCPNWGNAWSEQWESLGDPVEPPVYGPALRWTGNGWESSGSTTTTEGRIGG